MKRSGKEYTKIIIKDKGEVIVEITDSIIHAVNGYEVEFVPVIEQK